MAGFSKNDYFGLHVDLKAANHMKLATPVFD